VRLLHRLDHGYDLSRRHATQELGGRELFGAFDEFEAEHGGNPVRISVINLFLQGEQ
jgi:hypothetical protein